MTDLKSAPTIFNLSMNLSQVNITQSPYAPHIREGIVFDKWPFRLDIPVEYQDWILVGMCMFMTSIWCAPCMCGRLKNKASKRFTAWVYTRLHTYFVIATYLNLGICMFVVGICPDWTVNEFVEYFVEFVAWVLIHLKKMIVSGAILLGFFMLLKFRDRIAMAAGMEHVTVLRFSWKDMFCIPTKKRPIEIIIWKLDELQSSGSKGFVKANDVFVECHFGYNEPMRTRVHNNAGHSCVIKESFQVNIEEAASATVLTLLVKDQSLIASSELARLMLSTREVFGIEDQTGKRRTDFTYSEECFVALNLLPRGRIWLAIAPVDDGDEERAPLVKEDALVTC